MSVTKVKRKREDRGQKTQPDLLSLCSTLRWDVSCVNGDIPCTNSIATANLVFKWTVWKISICGWSYSSILSRFLIPEALQGTWAWRLHWNVLYKQSLCCLRIALFIKDWISALIKQTWLSWRPCCSYMLQPGTRASLAQSSASYTL